MTIICALHEPGVGTWIGSDRRRVFSGVPSDWQRKWDVVGNRALGLSGNGRAVTVLHHAAKQLLEENRDPHTLYDAMRRRIRDDGFKAEVSEGLGECYRFWGIYAEADSNAYGVGVYGIAWNGCITPVPPGEFWADGTGDKQAMGAAHVMMRHGGFAAETIVRGAVEAAIALDHECGGEPFVHLLKAS